MVACKPHLGAVRSLTPLYPLGSHPTQRLSSRPLVLTVAPELRPLLLTVITHKGWADGSLVNLGRSTPTGWILPGYSGWGSASPELGNVLQSLDGAGRLGLMPSRLFSAAVVYKKPRTTSGDVVRGKHSAGTGYVDTLQQMSDGPVSASTWPRGLPTSSCR